MTGMLRHHSLNLSILVALMLGIVAIGLGQPTPAAPPATMEGPRESPLWRALLLGDRPRVERLLKDGADANEPNGAGQTPLIFAAMDGDAHLARLLLAHGAHMGTRKDRCGSTVERAAVFGNAEVVRVLLGAGAPLDGPDYDQPLIVSAGKHQDVITVLLDAGADPNAGDGVCTCLHGAAAGGENRTVRLLLSRGANSNVRDSKGQSPIVLAAAEKQWFCVEILLANGADPNIPGDQKNTALHRAASSGEPEVVSMLLEHGAQVDATNAHGQTPLDLAVKHAEEHAGSAETIQILKRAMNQKP